MIARTRLNVTLYIYCLLVYYTRTYYSKNPPATRTVIIEDVFLPDLR